MTSYLTSNLHLFGKVDVLTSPNIGLERAGRDISVAVRTIENVKKQECVSRLSTSSSQMQGLVQLQLYLNI